MGLVRVALLVAAALVPSAGAAQDNASPEERFGARPTVIDMSLSPSGQRLAMVTPDAGAGETVLVFDVDNVALFRRVLANDQPNADITWCEWVNDARLICGIRAVDKVGRQLLGLTRLFLVDADGSRMEMLTAEAGNRAYGYDQDGGRILSWKGAGDNANTVLMTRDHLPAAGEDSVKKGLGVELVELDSLRRTTVEKAREEAIRYFADENGTVRLVEEREKTGGGYLTERTEFLFRPQAGGSLRRWKPGEGTPADFQPVAVENRTSSAYGFGSHDGFDALFSVALDESGRGTLLLSRPGTDVDQLIALGPGGRIVGASYATEKRQVEFFDPELSMLTRQLQEALPGNPLVELLDASEDEQRLLLIASSDTDPGRIFLFDKTKRHLDEIMPLRPELEGLAMGTMTPVTYPAADGTQIPAYLTLPPGSDGKGLPAIVLPHGGPSARDEWGFDWLVQYFVHRGYAVLQPNFRGSAGYGSAWFQKNGFQSWETAIGDVNDAGRWLVAEGVARADRLAVVGWSYGGYAALQSAVVDPQLYKAIVAIAPVTDLAQLSKDAKRFNSYRLVKNFVGEGPHVAAGSPARHADRFVAPVLLFHGDVDENVDVGHSQEMEKELRRARRSVDYVEFKGLDHQLDETEARSTMLGRIDTFLRASTAP